MEMVNRCMFMLISDESFVFSGQCFYRNFGEIKVYVLSKLNRLIMANVKQLNNRFENILYVKSCFKEIALLDL